MPTAIDKLQEARRIYDMAAEASQSLASAKHRADDVNLQLRRNKELAQVFTEALKRPLWTLFVGILIGSFIGSFMAAAASNWYRWAENAVLSWWGG